MSPYPRKAFYSNYGTEQITVAAPGGDSREFFGTPQYNAPQNRILNAYPLNVAEACGEVDANGVPNGQTTCPPSVPRHDARRAARARLLPGHVRPVPVDPGHVDGRRRTPPASPRVIVAAHGERDRAHGGLTLRPGPGRADPAPHGDEHAVPAPASRSSTREPASAGTRRHLRRAAPAFNGFYGDGIVNAWQRRAE